MQKSIQVEAFVTPDGQPTCALDQRCGKVCMFKGSRKFGLTEICVINGQDLSRGPNDEGYLIPDVACPIWN